MFIKCYYKAFDLGASSIVVPGDVFCNDPTNTLSSILENERTATRTLLSQ